MLDTPKADDVALASGLEELLNLQLPLLALCGDYCPTKEVMARYGNALQIEVAEFINEVPWKTWKTDDPSAIGEEQKEVIAGEFADVLAFLGTWLNLLSLMGIGIDQLAEAYYAKNAINHDRMAGLVEGYGVQ